MLKQAGDGSIYPVLDPSSPLRETADFVLLFAAKLNIDLLAYLNDHLKLGADEGIVQLDKHVTNPAAERPAQLQEEIEEGERSRSSQAHAKA